MFSFFFKKKAIVQHQSDFIFTDMHSHVLPGLDDGAEQVEESVAMLKRLSELGYKKAILTPHIMGDAYQNTPEGIRAKLALLKSHAIGIDIQIECAA